MKELFISFKPYYNFEVIHSIFRNNNYSFGFQEVDDNLVYVFNTTKNIKKQDYNKLFMGFVYYHKFWSLTSFVNYKTKRKMRVSDPKYYRIYNTIQETEEFIKCCSDFKIEENGNTLDNDFFLNHYNFVSQQRRVYFDYQKRKPSYDEAIQEPNLIFEIFDKDIFIQSFKDELQGISTKVDDNFRFLFNILKKMNCSSQEATEVFGRYKELSDSQLTMIGKLK